MKKKNCTAICSDSESTTAKQIKSGKYLDVTMESGECFRWLIIIIWCLFFSLRVSENSRWIFNQKTFVASEKQKKNETKSKKIIQKKIAKLILL